MSRLERKAAFALSFWLSLLAFIALDWQAARPHNRFEEPPPWALRQPAVEGAGHCAAPLK
jgi:predicted membrane metal-binding protein